MWVYFQKSDFACSHCGNNLTQDKLITALDELRVRVGFPLRITSGYRCPVHNVAVSSTGAAGPHTSGLACDIGVDREKAYIVLREAFAMGVFNGIGVNQKGNARFIHLDMRDDKTVWSY